MDEPTDQEIDTAGTEADEKFDERHDDKKLRPPDVTKGPLGAPQENTQEERGSDHRSLHRAEDDDAAYARSPEFHDREPHDS